MRGSLHTIPTRRCFFTRVFFSFHQATVLLSVHLYYFLAVGRTARIVFALSFECFPSSYGDTTLHTRICLHWIAGDVCKQAISLPQGGGGCMHACTIQTLVLAVLGFPSSGSSMLDSYAPERRTGLAGSMMLENHIMLGVRSWREDVHEPIYFYSFSHSPFFGCTFHFGLVFT